MDNNFSVGYKELIAKSREVALDLGYDYISSIHFLIADYELNDADIGVSFWFKNKEAFEDFKNVQRLVQNGEKQNFDNVSLPLTKEAEITIRLSIEEVKMQKHDVVYSWHFFIAALKNETSLIFELFKEDEFSLANLVKYYNSFIKAHYNTYYAQKDFTEFKAKPSFLNRIKNLFQ